MTTTSPTPLLAFNCASTFFVDPGTVKNSPEVSVTGVELYFSSKPKANNNVSGIYKPGVEVYLCEMKVNGYEEVPDTARVIRNSRSRVEWDQINVSNSANTATLFSMPLPPNLDTGRSYAIVVKYDGNESFGLWKSVEGKKLVGTNSTTAGPSGKYIGKYYEYSHAAATGNTASNGQAAGVNGSWKPLNTTDLKFKVYIAKYTADLFANTTSVDPATGESTTTVVAKRSFMLEKQPYEFIVFDPLRSNNITSLHGGEVVYQNTVPQAQTISVSAGSRTVTSQAANLAALYGNGTDPKWIVIYSGTEKNVRLIETINSNNAVTLDIPVNFTNAAARFAKVVAGRVDLYSKIDLFGRSETALVIANSNANSTLRFTNNTVESITVVAAGSGYSNTDYVLVNGGGPSGAPEANATGTIVTNGAGAIQSVTVNNKGVGFLLNPTYVINNANNVASGGTSANLSISIGATLMTEHSNATIANIEVINIPINSAVFKAVDIENPYGTSYQAKSHFQYYAPSQGVNDVTIVAGGTGYANGDVVSFSGLGTGAKAKVVTDSAGKIVSVVVVASGSGYSAVPTTSIATSGGTGASLTAKVGTYRNAALQEHVVKDVQFDVRADMTNSHIPMLLSRSYEVTMPNTSIVTQTGTTVNTNISSLVELVLISNNVYVTADIISSQVDVFMEKFAINNDYSLEETGDGKALSKHVSQMVNFGDNRLAEDIRVFADLYRPVGSDVKVYARVHNNNDPEAFVDKDWTLLEIKNGEDRYSSPTNINDVIEFEFGFPSYPNSAFTGNGVVTTTLTSANLVGTNTNFTTEFANGDLIRVYSPLFNENHQVAVIQQVVNSSLITLASNIANSSVVGDGFLIDKLAYKNQAFNNKQNNQVSRYYGNNMAAFDGYNSFAVKVVFLSENETIIPKVENIRAVGVTA